MRIAITINILTVAGSLFAASPCLAQSPAPVAEYPNRPIRLVVPFVPGGTNDVLGRILAGKFSERFGHQIVVDNRPGAGATIGSAIVARASPDGHTLLITGAGHTINPSIYRALPYDTESDFAPVGLVGGGAYVMVVHPSVPAKTAKEFAAWVRSRRGEVSYASAGVGNPTHLAAELLNIAAAIDMQHVPYNGDAGLDSGAGIDVLRIHLDSHSARSGGQASCHRRDDRQACASHARGAHVHRVRLSGLRGKCLVRVARAGQDSA